MWKLLCHLIKKCNMNICQWPAGKVQRRMFSLHWKWILLKLFNMRICTAHTRNSIPRVHPPQCSPWRVRFLKLYSWIFISSCPFCLGRIITIKHKGIRFPLFFFFNSHYRNPNPNMEAVGRSDHWTFTNRCF